MILTNYEGSNDDYENGGTTYRRAQGFRVPNDATIESVSIFGSRGNGAIGTFSVRISSGATEPDQTALLYSETFNTTILTTFGSAAWNEIVLASGVSVVAGTQYWLEIRPLTGSANDEIRWSRDGTSPTYPNGQWNYTFPSSTVWQNPGATSDYNFRISGTESGGGGGAPTPLRLLMGVGS